ncbi:hypothetical protein AXG93_1072s1000 [Marchantia polymorpha subsp. ruderalis]|uniref:glutathione transferase n=1 Tax=Marchantia polymorpha subsp. ruderalis TaxID=1480154 RepID=A0A176W4C3_MARPO|nr:hypothetical protein AXG93_1072s1000 [Marchantia polymorpha subsp. ruderalis]
MKLYGVPGSICTTRVLVTAAEKGLDKTQLQHIPVDISAGDQKKPQYLAIQVPALQDGDLTLFESRAVIRYLADKYEGQGTPLYGSSNRDRALVEQWLEVESHNFNPHISIVLNELVFTMSRGEDPDTKLVTTHYERLDRVLDVYEAHLSRQKYLAGDFFSLADLSHLPTIFYLIRVAKKPNVIFRRPHVLTWWQLISNRPAWKAIAPSIMTVTKQPKTASTSA